MKNVFFRDDFKLRMRLHAPEGSDSGIPPIDFRIVFESGESRYEAGRKDGEFFNCSPDEEDPENSLVIAFNHHGLLPCRELGAKIIFFVPDSDFSDGIRRVEREYPTGVCLTMERCDLPRDADWDVMLPYFRRDILPKEGFSILVENNHLRIFGAAKYLEEGFVPYLFRHTCKVNGLYKNEEWGHGAIKRGWNLFGSYHSVKVDGEKILFTRNRRNDVDKPNDGSGYSEDAGTLVEVREDNRAQYYVGWGKRKILLKGRESRWYRPVKLRFGLAFGKKIEPGRIPVTPANMVTPLYEFTVTVVPPTDMSEYPSESSFGRCFTR